MTASLSQPRPPQAFFGRRKGPALRARQQNLMDALLPRLAVDLAAPPPAALAALFPHEPQRIGLEIGFGGGEHLISEARAHQDWGFLGCEAYVNGMAKMLAALDGAPAANLRLVFDDALRLLHWLPPASLDRIDLIHPDPWPKRRQWKRRFVQPATIARMAALLKPGGLFRFVSDIADYVDWTGAHFAAAPGFSRLPGDETAPWPGYVLTRYGEKAMREGRAARYLQFRRAD